VRTQRVSVVLEDSFRSAHDLTAIVEAFSADGYRTRIEAVAVSRAESLLALTARQMRTIVGGGGGVRDGRRDVDEGTTTVEAMIRSVPASTSVVVVVNRDGTRNLTASGAAAVAALKLAQNAPLSGRAAAEWISELRRITSVAASRATGRDDPLIETLADLHRTALREVLPNIALPDDSTARQQLDARVRRDLSALESAIVHANATGAGDAAETSRTTSTSRDTLAHPS
jgi:hypothetical protein